MYELLKTEPHDRKKKHIVHNSRVLQSRLAK